MSDLDRGGRVIYLLLGQQPNEQQIRAVEEALAETGCDETCKVVIVYARGDEAMLH